MLWTMKEEEYLDAMREIIFYFFAAPATILIGMAGVGAIIDTLLRTDGSTFAQLFTYIGGIPGIAGYYYKKWKEFSSSKLEIKKD